VWPGLKRAKASLYESSLINTQAMLGGAYPQLRLAHPRLRLTQQQLRSKNGNGNAHVDLPMWKQVFPHGNAINFLFGRVTC
jgi:hypothetical protein